MTPIMFAAAMSAVVVVLELRHERRVKRLYAEALEDSERFSSESQEEFNPPYSFNGRSTNYGIWDTE